MRCQRPRRSSTISHARPAKASASQCSSDRQAVRGASAGSSKPSAMKHEAGDHTRVGSLFKIQGEKTQKLGEAAAGDLVAVAKIDEVRAGQWLGAGSLPPPIEVEYPARNCAIAIEPADRKDDVKLSGALQRLLEEDGGLVVEHDDVNHEIRLRGVNDEH